MAHQPLSTDAELVAACGPGDPAVYGAGPPTVESFVRTDVQVVLALQSTDGRAWSACRIDLSTAGDDTSASSTLYGDEPDETGVAYTTGTDCTRAQRADGTCPSWSVSAVNRLPEPVAAVRYDFFDGSSTTVATEDGYVVLNESRPLPDGYRFARDGLVVSPARALTRITYLDATGTPIAASGLRARDRAVAGLPPLSRYPALRASG